MARKQKHEEHENHERWLVSYADFITLLFAFFVVMYAVSSVNTGKYRVLSDSLVAAFSAPTKTIEPIQVGELSRSPKVENQNILKKPTVLAPPRPPFPDTPVEVREEQAKDAQMRLYDEAMVHDKARLERELAALQGAVGDTALKESVTRIADAIERALAELIQQKQVNVQRDQSRLEIEINESILFGSGRARLEPQAIPVIKKISDILKDFTNGIHVEGFTDNIPIQTLEFPSNWELSAARAASVAHLLADEGIEPSRLAAVGYGEQRPLADNATAEGRRKNRRIVLAVLGDVETRRQLEAAKPGISRERTVPQAKPPEPLAPAPLLAHPELTVAPPVDAAAAPSDQETAPAEELLAQPASSVASVPDVPSLPEAAPAPAAEELAASMPVAPAPSAPTVRPVTAGPIAPPAIVLAPMAPPIRLFVPLTLPSVMPAQGDRR